MNIESKLFSDLLDELCDIKAALRIANLFLIHHSSNGDSAKIAQTVDTVRRLEQQLGAVKLELDRRFPQNESDNNTICSPT